MATPSGGLHLYYAAPDGVQLHKTEGDRVRGLGWKIDTRAWGGYMVAPGSLIDGRAYTPTCTCTTDRWPRCPPGWPSGSPTRRCPRHPCCRSGPPPDAGLDRQSVFGQ